MKANLFYVFTCALIVGALVYFDSIHQKSLDDEYHSLIGQDKHHQPLSRWSRHWTRRLDGPAHPVQVEGIRNEDVVFVVASTGKYEGMYIRERIIPSARTWMKDAANVYVVVEDTVEIRLLMRHCKAFEVANFTAFDCPNEPTYVLTRVCTNEYYNAAGICCKFDESINFVAAHIMQYTHTKYLIQCDDDMYWRVDQVLRWLSALEAANTASIPLVASGEKSATLEAAKYHGGGLWHIKGCHDIFTNGWYQPIMLNKAALERIKVGTRSFGGTSVCQSFQMSQDAGLGVLFWMYEINHVYFPGVFINGGHGGVSILKPHQMGIHAIRHIPDDKCNGLGWPAHLRYKQSVILGCGDVDVDGPFHDTSHGADMYDVWRYFKANGLDLKFNEAGVHDFIKFPSDAPLVLPEHRSTADLEKLAARGDRLVPFINPLPGYAATEHHAKYNIMKEFHPFGMSDCKDKGSI